MNIYSTDSSIGNISVSVYATRSLLSSWAPFWELQAATKNKNKTFALIVETIILVLFFIQTLKISHWKNIYNLNQFPKKNIIIICFIFYTNIENFFKIFVKNCFHTIWVMLEAQTYFRPAAGWWVGWRLFKCWLSACHGHVQLDALHHAAIHLWIPAKTCSKITQNTSDLVCNIINITRDNMKFGISLKVVFNRVNWVFWFSRQFFFYTYSILAEIRFNEFQDRIIEVAVTKKKKEGQ